MNYVITIARGYGSGGKEIGEALGKELGIPCYEQQILKMASEYSGINEALFAKSDEKLKGSYLFNLLTKMQTSVMAGPEDKEFASNDNLFRIQSHIINELAEKKSCIIIGKCADYVLKNKRNVLSIYVEASREACLKRIMSKYDMTKEEANKKIDKMEKYRYDYYRYYTGGDWRNPVNYHMVLNSGRLGKEGCVEIIRHAAEEKFIKTAKKP